MGKNWPNVLRQKAQQNTLAPGQGAQKRKPPGKRRRGSQRHRRALRMPGRALRRMLT